MVRYVELQEHSGMTSVLVNPDTVQYLRHVANNCTQLVFAPGNSLTVTGYPKDVADRLRWFGSEDRDGLKLDRHIEVPRNPEAATVHAAWPRTA